MDFIGNKVIDEARQGEAFQLENVIASEATCPDTFGKQSPLSWNDILLRLITYNV